MDDVREVTIDQLLAHPEFGDLIQEYAEESSIEGMPHPIYKLEAYRGYEELGLIHIFEAVRDGALVGFITVIAPVLPHYSLPVAVVESFFVGSKNRAGGPGLRLLAAAEQQALEVGSPGLLVSAPFRGRLHELLPKCGYAETNRIFFKRVKDDGRSQDEPAGDRGGTWP